MGLLDMFFGRKRPSTARPRHSRPVPSTHFDSQLTQAGHASTHSVRKDVLRVALRETLTRNGIPPTWVSADMLRTNSASRRESGLHVRFLVRHWDPRLMQHAVALEGEFMHRLLLLDPLAGNWLMGFSWQFAMDDKSVCPSLPLPATWTAPPAPPAPSTPAPLPPPPEPEHSGYGDVIAGPTPVAQPRPLDDVRADLERLLALRDEDLRKHAPAERAYAPTRPATL